MVVLTMGCSHSTGETPDSDSADLLVIVGDSALAMREVLAKIPSGMAPEDSAEMFHRIVERWMENMLLTELASENIEDLERINRLTDDYRRKLIIATYRSNLRDAHTGGKKIPADSISRYYERHKDELLLTRPVIKGLYVKLPSDTKRLSDIRRWMQTATSDAIDNLEQFGLTDAIEYSFFEDQWIDWEVIRRQIPYRFVDADEFVKRTVNFETEHRGMTYLIHISGFIPSGEQMPMEVAIPVIRQRMESDQGEIYEKKLINGLFRKAHDEGRLRYINYNR